MKHSTVTWLAFLRSRTFLVGVSVLLLIATLGALFFINAQRVMEEQLKNRLRDDAALAALQFDPQLIERIHDVKDVQSPAFYTLVDQLNAIRANMPHIRFAYLLRHTVDPLRLEFVADADALKTEQQLDRNHDGVVEKDEMASYPGDVYDITDAPAMDAAFHDPSVDDAVSSDQWGNLISGYAPIRAKDGSTVAIIGLDMSADEYFQQARSIISPIVLMLMLVVALLMGTYVVIFIASRRVELISELDRQRSALMQLISHQLGAPLSSFKWSLDFIREAEKTRKTPEGNLSIQMISEGVARMEAMMTALQEALDVSSGRVQPPAQPSRVREVIERVANETGAVRAARKQHLEMEITENLPVVKLDVNLLSAVLRELLDNAMTYSPEGSTIAVRAYRTKNAIQVEVRDHGCGIPPHDLPHIFERFSRASNAYSSKPVGNGLGLYTAHEIIMRVDGEMWAESTVGKGTTVTFTLPL